MGLSSSKSKTSQTSTTAPSNYNQPYIDSAAGTLQPGYNAAMANNAKLMPNINNALDYSNSVLSGNYLNSNPYLNDVINSSNRDIANGVNSQFEGAGRYGSGNYAGVLARQLSDNENKLRFGNYEQERQYQQAAPGQIMGEVATSSALPQAAGSTYADQVRALLGQYNTTSGTATTTSSPNFGQMWLQAMAAAAQTAAMGG